MMQGAALDVRLVSACPGNTCDKSVTCYWVHHSCGGELRINQECDVWCETHPNSSKSFLQKWRFKCAATTHGGDHFVGWTLDALASALSYISRSFNGKCEAAVMIGLNNKLLERWTD